MKNKKSWVWIGLLIILLVLIFFAVYSKKNPSAHAKVINSETSSGLSLPVYLVNQEFVRELPKKASVSLRFFNFDSGKREWEENYIIEREIIRQSSNIESEKTDINIILHSKYISLINQYDLCGIIKQAKKNGDLGYELKISWVEFAWKYKSMFKYKECFGF